MSDKESARLPVEPTARTYTLADLVTLLREGQIRVPHFQRGLRWNSDDAVKLVDSVLRGFPIGSLLLWKRRAPRETFRLGDVQLEADELQEALYVVDGQQRLTTFLNIFDPRAGETGEFALVYDLSETPHRVRKRPKQMSGDQIPLPTLFHLPTLLKWTRDNPGYMDSIEWINAATTRLREFHVPAYEVRSDDDEALRDIYDRMNAAGKRLSRAEAFWGLYAPGEGHKTADASLQDIQDQIRAMGWGSVDADTLLAAFLSRRGPDTTRDIRLEFSDDRKARGDFPGETPEDAHRGARAAIEDAISFLRDKAGVPHISFLAYRFQLVALTRFFAHFPEPSPRILELLKRWYWRTALSGPSVAKGSATGAMRSLSACIVSGEEEGSVERLLLAIRTAPRFPVNYARFRAPDASANIILCALWDLGPRNPLTGELFSYHDLDAELGVASSPNSIALEVLPRSELSDHLRLSVGNRAILPGVPSVAASALAAARPLVLDEVDGATWAEVQSSHLVDELVGEGNEDGWVTRRAARIQTKVRSFLERMLGEVLEDTAPLESFNFDDDDDEVQQDW